MEKELFSAKKKKGEKRMRKEWVICIVVILIVVITNIIIQNFTDNSVDSMDEELKELKEELINEEVEHKSVEEKMQKVMKTWEEKYERLAYFIEHDELEKVETELISLSAYIDIEEYDHGVPELEKSIFILYHIKDKFKFDIKNIF